MEGTNHDTFWEQLLLFLKDNTIPGGLFILFYRGIGKVSEYFSEKRKSELKEIAKETANNSLMPEINLLKTRFESIEDRLNDILHILAERK